MRGQGESKDPMRREPRPGIVEQRVLGIDRRASWRGSRRNADWLKHREEEAAHVLRQLRSPEASRPLPADPGFLRRNQVLGDRFDRGA